MVAVNPGKGEPMTTDPDARARPTPHPPPHAFSTSCNSTAINLAPASPTRGPCPKTKPSTAPSPTLRHPDRSAYRHAARCDLETLLWSTVNSFPSRRGQHPANARRQRGAQKRSQKEQDGSEIRSVELERLIGEGTALIERRELPGTIPRRGRRPLSRRTPAHPGGHAPVPR